MILLMDTLEMTPVNAKQVKQWTDYLSKVCAKVQKGDRRPDDHPQMQPHIKRMDELSIQDGCVMWVDGVVIPQAGREKVLKILHDGHPGMLRMERIARGVVWWPKIDTAIEKTVQDCQACKLYQKLPAPCTNTFAPLGMAYPTLVENSH